MKKSGVLSLLTRAHASEEVTMPLFEHFRAFLVNASKHTRAVLGPLFGRHVVSLTAPLALASFILALRYAAMAVLQTPNSTNAEPRPRRMVHLKTKEECRLGNETIRVWTVELPSRHAEGILK
jgi:hypothetical protein